MKMKKFIIWENRNWWPHNTYISYTLISLYRAPLKLWVLVVLRWQKDPEVRDSMDSFEETPRSMTLSKVEFQHMLELSTCVHQRMHSSIFQLAAARSSIHTGINQFTQDPTELCVNRTVM